MRVLCTECFNQITDIQKNTATCSHCGATYELKQKASLFKVRLEGGYIKENLLYDDIVKGIREGKILADEYIASHSGPWIHIYDSPFEEYYKQDIDKAKRGGIILYKKKKKKISLTLSLTILLIISILSNFGFIVLLFLMKNRIDDLINKLTGG